MPKTQSAAKHAKYDPITHFVLMPIFTINLGLSIYWAVHDPEHRLGLDLWLVVLAFALILVNMKMRLYSLRVQDRVIRLEERLRVSALASPAEASRLSTGQLIALRFASDEELPMLVAHTLGEGLTSRQIKERITTWRPDLARV